MKNLGKPIKSLLELYIGMRVQDNEGNIGTVKECDDIHNIFVEFDNGGTGLHCLIEGCADNIRINDDDVAIPYYSPLYNFVEMRILEIEKNTKVIVNMPEETNATFRFTISDGHCSYEYPLNISDKYSIYMIAERIYKAFNLKKEMGRLVKGNDY